MRRRSPSSRRAWIEINKDYPEFLQLYVALLAEGVDRNSTVPGCIRMGRMVALLAEGVDRNNIFFDDAVLRTESPSSRRAWIEILVAREVKRAALVALLAEGVDRNTS